MTGNLEDYYTLLGVERDASTSEIDRAYRRAARAAHPDVHPDEPTAGARFVAVAIAYETLGDPARRATYDRSHPIRRAPLATPAVRVTPSASRSPWRAPVEPVNLGPHRAPREPLTVVGPRPRLVYVDAAGDQLLELAAALSRVLCSGWPLL